MSAVTSIRPGRDLGAAEITLSQAIGIVDLLQGAAARGAIEPPSNEESLARTLAVVLELLDKTHGAIFPEPAGAGEKQP
ncbi:MAG TPA: hypothetical protein VN882_05055 [Steroidobacteraceae bacterium]|nr:hypothetical protein [Steroidobacteraceae bacterium]